MLLSEWMIPEFTREMAMTRKLLTKIPNDKLGWKPMDGLQTIGWNATHLAETASWIPTVLTTSELDIAPTDGPAFTQVDATDVQGLLKTFDANVAQSLAALKGVPDSVMDDTWTMKMGGQTIFTMKKGDCIRKWIFSHTAHHRAILSTYLRLAGVPHTSVYEDD